MQYLISDCVYNMKLQIMFREKSLSFLINAVRRSLHFPSQRSGIESNVNITSKLFYKSDPHEFICSLGTTCKHKNDKRLQVALARHHPCIFNYWMGTKHTQQLYTFSHFGSYESTTIRSLLMRHLHLNPKQTGRKRVLRRRLLSFEFWFLYILENCNHHKQRVQKAAAIRRLLVWKALILILIFPTFKLIHSML